MNLFEEAWRTIKPAEKTVTLTKAEVDTLRWLASRYVAQVSEPAPFDLSIDQRIAAAKAAVEKLS